MLVVLRRITRALDLRSRMLLQEYGLTLPQLTAMRAIARLQPVTAVEIAREIHLGQPTITGILGRLEQRGLVERHRADRDRRTVNVRLTEFGERMLMNAPSPLLDQLRNELAKLKPWERTQMLATVERLADMLDAPPEQSQDLLPEEIADVARATGMWDEAESHSAAVEAKSPLAADHAPAVNPPSDAGYPLTDP